MAHATGSLFAKPVDDTIAPGYSEIVALPMCFADIKARLGASWYTGTLSVRNDIERIRLRRRASKHRHLLRVRVYP